MGRSDSIAVIDAEEYRASTGGDLFAIFPKLLVGMGKAPDVKFDTSEKAVVSIGTVVKVRVCSTKSPRDNLLSVFLSRS